MLHGIGDVLYLPGGVGVQIWEKLVRGKNGIYAGLYNLQFAP